MPLPPLLDAFVPATALGQAIGRLGCFAAGCCFGTPSDASWAVTFTSPDAAALGGTPLHQALHPVQLYDALAHVVLFAGLLVLHRRMQFRGRLLGLWCVAEGFTRFFIESFRGDGGRGLWLDSDWLSTGRITALLMMALGAYLLQRLPEWSPPPTDAEQKSPKSSASSRKSRRKPKTEGVSQHNEPD
jgi:phosphatidylglycerol:prolipoprotein diacylglycerol transferase